MKRLIIAVLLLLCGMAGAQTDWLSTVHFGGVKGTSTTGYAAGNTSIDPTNGIRTADNLVVGGTLALTGTFSGTNLTLSGTLGVAGTASLGTTSGNATVGVNDSTRGLWYAYGASGSAFGGESRWYNSSQSTYDDATDYFQWYTSSGNLRLDLAGGSLGSVNVWQVNGGTGAMTFPAAVTYGDASTDVFSMTGRLQLRSVTDPGMSATAGSAREILYNSSDSRFYASLAGGSPATDWGYFLRNTDATQVLKNTNGVTLDLKDSDSTSSVDWIRGLGTSGSSDTYGAGIRLNGGNIEFYTDASPTDTSNNLTQRMKIASNGTITYGTSGDALITKMALARDDTTVGYYPAAFSLDSDGGTSITRYLWLSDAGNLRIHSSAPTADTDGEILYPDGLFGAQVGSLLSTERSTTSASYTQVTGTGSGLAVTVSARTNEVIVDYQGKVSGDNGSIKVVLATTDTGSTLPNGIETAGGYFYDSGSAYALSQSVQTLTTASHSSYTKFRTHFRCTRLAAGTYYVNVFFLNDTGGGNTTYIDEISVYTN